ncbi:MAG: TatD family hydrolase [Tractidigestivibacter sp.]|uniref:TatD family hydrolase n=1 Tax=Tractidigestivibacter sp. TaxID=2847320 RepID=UPI003D8EECF0
MPNEPICLDALTLEDGQLFHDKKGRPRELPRALAPLADSHGHLTSFRGRDASAAICRAALAGVRLLVVPVDPVDEIPRKFASPAAYLDWINRQVDEAARLLDQCASRGLVPPVPLGWEGVDLPDLVDNVHIVAGVHPYGADAFDDGAIARLEELLSSPRCVGVGEIGLDFGPYNELGASVQEEAFRKQLDIAGEHGLPVELHIRDGVEEDDHSARELAVRVLSDCGVPAAGCDLHCFTDGPEVMRPFVELGCYIAFGGAATFKRSGDIRAAAAACPTDRLLSETDCPYMAPVPLRGEECEPAMVAFSAACVAHERDVAGTSGPAATYRAFWENACALFSL